jgi:hypothetical protein
MADDKDISIDPKELDRLMKSRQVLEEISDIVDATRAISKKKREEVEKEKKELQEISDLTSIIADRKAKILVIEQKIKQTYSVMDSIQRQMQETSAKMEQSVYKSELLNDTIKSQNVILAQKEKQYAIEIATGKVTDRTKYARLREINAIKDLIKLKSEELSQEEKIQSFNGKKLAALAREEIYKNNLLMDLRDELKILKLEQEKDEAKKKSLERLSSMRKIHKQIEESLFDEIEGYNKIKKLVIDIYKGGLAGMLSILNASLDRWKELDRAAKSFRDETGLLTIQTVKLDKAAREVNVQMASLGVSISDAYAAGSALTTQFQVIGLVTKDMIADTAQMAANLGIAVSDAAKFRGLFTSISKSAGMTSTETMQAATALAVMGDVAPSVALKDMAEASEDTLAFLAKSPMALIKATVEARRLGTTVNALSKSARGFLNYQDSITSELEASALIGKALNFQEARAAAYAGDVVKSRELALKQIQKAGDFTKLNVYQQEALAKAAGMTVDEVIKQQNQQKMMAEFRAQASGKDKKMLEDYDAMLKKIADDEKSSSKNLVAKGREMMQQRLRQSEMNKLAASFSAIWTDIADALLPIANAIMPVILNVASLLAVVFKVIGAAIRGFLSPFDKFFEKFRSGNKSAIDMEKILQNISEWTTKWIIPAFELLGTILGNIYSMMTKVSIALSFVWNGGYKLKDAFMPFVNLMESVSGLFLRIGSNISKIGSGFSSFGKLITPFFKALGSVPQVFGYVFKLFGSFAKLLGPLGIIINIAQLAFSLWSKFSELFASSEFINAPWYEKIWMGIKAIGGALYDVFIQPFVDAWNWLKKKFIANSPSELGLSIVKGIKSVGSTLFRSLISPFKAAFDMISNLKFSSLVDVITWPFRKAFEFIQKIPYIGKLFGGGNTDAAVEVSTDAQVKAVAKSISSTVDIRGISELKETVDKLVDAINKLGGAAGAGTPVVNVNNNSAAMVEKLDELIGLLKDGAIGINMDGSKVSRVLAKAS